MLRTTGHPGLDVEERKKVRSGTSCGQHKQNDINKLRQRGNQMRSPCTGALTNPEHRSEIVKRTGHRKKKRTGENKIHIQAGYLNTLLCKGYTFF